MKASDLWPLVERVRDQSPLVQCITNYVAMDVTANILLAAGASPAMVHATEEAADFARLGGTLSINMGTPSPEWVDGMMAAAAEARAKGSPWVLDPVAVGATPYRGAIAAGLLPFGPAVIRGNAGEIMTLAGSKDAVGKGVDSTQSAASASDAADALAARWACVVAATGEIDIVTDGARRTVLGNGHVMMTKVTALGCSLSALVGAFLAVSEDRWLAAAAAVGYFGVCGEIAAEGAPGPASLRDRLIDQLYALDGETFGHRLKVIG